MGKHAGRKAGRCALSLLYGVAVERATAPLTHSAPNRAFGSELHWPSPSVSGEVEDGLGHNSARWVSTTISAEGFASRAIVPQISVPMSPINC